MDDTDDYSDDECLHRGVSTPAIQKRIKCACTSREDDEQCECRCHWDDE